MSQQVHGYDNSSPSSPIQNGLAGDTKWPMNRTSGYQHIANEASRTADESKTQQSPGLPLNNRPKEHGGLNAQYDNGFFNPWETYLIQSARRDIISHRQSTKDDSSRLKKIFWSVVVLSILFPLVSLLVLVGAFDSTVSWYTHGELDSFTKKQRLVFKRLLFAQVVVYIVSIVVLSLHFSVGLS